MVTSETGGKRLLLQSVKSQFDNLHHKTDADDPTVLLVLRKI